MGCQIGHLGPRLTPSKARMWDPNLIFLAVASLIYIACLELAQNDCQLWDPKPIPPGVFFKTAPFNEKLVGRPSITSLCPTQCSPSLRIDFLVLISASAWRFYTQIDQCAHWQAWMHIDLDLLFPYDKSGFPIFSEKLQTIFPNTVLHFSPNSWCKMWEKHFVFHLYLSWKKW
jgi:hypothetical protein